MDLFGNEFSDVLSLRNKTWKKRVLEWLNRETAEGNKPFLLANCKLVRRSVVSKEFGPRMIVNIPADALLSFLKSKKYLNAYERPIVGSKKRGASTQRQKVDRLLFEKSAKKYYFGAVSFGGTGIRFYGEYCLVLNSESVDASTQIFDRNSYDLVREPLRRINDKDQLVDRLKGEWENDLEEILVMKILPSIRNENRLLTAGTISDETLHDEDYIEVHRKGSFAPSDLEEIRQSPEDCVVRTQIGERLSNGVLPTVEELIWSARRWVVEDRLAVSGIKLQTVVSSGRGTRWR